MQHRHPTRREHRHDVRLQRVDKQVDHSRWCRSCCLGRCRPPAWTTVEPGGCSDERVDPPDLDHLQHRKQSHQSLI